MVPAESDDDQNLRPESLFQRVQQERNISLAQLLVLGRCMDEKNPAVKRDFESCGTSLILSLVEPAGIEPASVSPLQAVLHT